MGNNITLDNGATLTFTLIASWHDMGRERGCEAQIEGEKTPGAMMGPWEIASGEGEAMEGRTTLKVAFPICH